MMKTKISDPAGDTFLALGRVVGRRKGRQANLWADADRLQRTFRALRGSDRLVPRGVYRFATFEEADHWMIQMMARTHARQTSKTSPGSQKP